jgi:hypothetical protein
VDGFQLTFPKLTAGGGALIGGGLTAGLQEKCEPSEKREGRTTKDALDESIVLEDAKLLSAVVRNV